MNDLLKDCYHAFYDAPWKSNTMFDVMDKTAECVFTGKGEDTEAVIKASNNFYDTFNSHARTDEQKIALERLLSGLLQL